MSQSIILMSLCYETFRYIYAGLQSPLQDKTVAFKIFELGLKRFGDDPNYVLAYIDHLSHLNGNVTDVDHSCMPIPVSLLSCVQSNLHSTQLQRIP